MKDYRHAGVEFVWVELGQLTVRLFASAKQVSGMCDGVRRGDFPAGTTQSVVRKHFI